MKAFSLQQKGFTLVELIVVIVLVGIIAGMIAVIIKAPIQGYVDSDRRAGLTDMADTALRRIGRDLRTAVPNSVRMASPSSSAYVEFLPTRDAGMYQSFPGASGPYCGGTLAQDILDFTVADSCFAIMGPRISMIKTPADFIVIGSTQSNALPPYDTSINGVLREYTGITSSVQAINFTSTQFPSWAQLQSQRFQVIPGDQQAVTYACMLNGVNGTPSTSPGTDSSGNGLGQLIRYWNYWPATGPTNSAQIAPPLSGPNAILVNNVSACNIVYSTDFQNYGLISITLKLTQANESVQLYDEIHVNNQP